MTWVTIFIIWEHLNPRFTLDGKRSTGFYRFFNLRTSLCCVYILISKLVKWHDKFINNLHGKQLFRSQAGLLAAYLGLSLD